MLKRMTEREVFAREDIHIFQYTTNIGGLKIMEFGALFLLVIAVLIYPFTHFDPPIWMIAPVILTAASFILFGISFKWRKFARKAYVAYDDEYLFIGNEPEKTACIPWESLDVHNTGLDQPKAGADLIIKLEGEEVELRLFTNVVCIPQFETILRTILQHIQNNQKK